MENVPTKHYFLVRNLTTGIPEKPGFDKRHLKLKDAKTYAIEQAELTGQTFAVYEIRKVGTAGPITPRVAWRAGK